MGFRFSKRVKILPGVRLNFSKNGVSTSLGPRGASVTVGKKGIHGNVGIPGTGLSYRTRLDRPSGQSGGRTNGRAPVGDAPSSGASALGYIIAAVVFIGLIALLA
ncbi:DUF4236 domain-containing protein [Defluviimonas salinarum]|uniref:DUF4236 domain-containing protein n=1 Tax=Defluviimonas salinarum TaxID=2992147 RepID=A0ABT3J8B5_9RHOB|nr:DUF4236 domain-containing protein [Defluviimonas salinarum]MCW3783900.1 DUF4236 domain-containing protein [Defluviimonas salinarum]